MKQSVSSVAALASAAGVVIWCLSVHRRRRKQVEEQQKLAAEAEKTEEEWLRELKQELYASVMPFWMDHSVDKEHGGFFSCLDRHGGLFDADKKYIWLNGRAVWMTSELVRSTSDEELRAMSGGRLSHKALLEACIKGADFLLDHALILDDGGGGGGGAATAAAGSAVVVSQAWFCLNADGSKPVHLERKPFSAMFLCQGVANTARLLKERGDAGWVRYASGAAAVLEAVRKMVSAPETLGRPSCPGAAYKAWNVPMIFLSVLETFADGDDEFLAAANGLERAALEAEVEWCVDELLSHMVDSRRVAVENVGKLSEENNNDGGGGGGGSYGYMPSTWEGRLVIPGHGIECAWFLMDYALKRLKRADHSSSSSSGGSSDGLGGDASSKLARRYEGVFSRAVTLMEWSFEAGWDHEQWCREESVKGSDGRGGGLRYFVDSEECFRGAPDSASNVLMLEKDMKLWWVHAEAMVAHAMAFAASGNRAHWERFQLVTHYTLRHFSDAPWRRPGGGGEWFGYCDRSGRATHSFKGGPYKCAFHTPRALLLCIRVLEGLVARARDPQRQEQKQ